MKIQYISDLHLEHHKNNNVFSRIKKLPNCENICVLGDIGYPHSQIYQDFMTYCSNNWKNVFWLLGNHEFYHKPKTDIKTMSEIEEYVKQICPKNVYFMNNSVVYLNKETNEVGLSRTNDIGGRNPVIKIIGCTLWCNINDFTAQNLNDYYKIYAHHVVNDFGVDMFRKLKPEMTRMLFDSSRKFILDEIKNENDNVNCLIITHHGTHPLCQGHYLGSPLESGYATYIPEIYESKNVIASLFGHTHSNVTLEVNGVKLLSNCYGYKGERQDIVKFNPKAVLEIQ
jgi:predicted phosphodiesterase